MKTGSFLRFKPNVTQMKEGRSMGIKKVIALSLSGLAASAFLVLLAACATFNEWEVAGGGYGLYKKNCSGCHGMNGEGNPPAGTKLKGSKFIADSTMDDIKEVIRMGRKGEGKEYPEFLTESGSFKNMPGFTDRTIPNAELNVLAKWLKDGMKQR